MAMNREDGEKKKRKQLVGNSERVCTGRTGYSVAIEYWVDTC